MLWRATFKTQDGTPFKFQSPLSGALARAVVGKIRDAAQDIFQSPLSGDVARGGQFRIQETKVKKFQSPLSGEVGARDEEWSQGFRPDLVSVPSAGMRRARFNYAKRVVIGKFQSPLGGEVARSSKR